MDLYTLTPGFLRDELVDGFISTIWTERFFQPGDCSIVVPATPIFRRLLKEGKFLAIKQSKEVMIVDEHNVDGGLLTVKGKTLDEFLNSRQAWFENLDATEGQQSTKEYAATTTIGQFIADVVTKTVIDPVVFTVYPDANLDWDNEKIPNLSLGEIDTAGPARPRTMPIGKLADGLRTLATDNGLGFRIFLESADESGYSLKFALWRGRDRSSSQSTNPLVRLTPNMDSLTGVKEVLSISGYKNVMYVHYKNKIYTFYAEPTLPIPQGFDRRSFVRMADGDVPSDQLAAYIAQQAADGFANNNYIRAVDGEASIPSEYTYQRDYRLGDVIELEGLTGLLTKARVTEYIRSSDQTGDKEYPTIAVVDPLDTGNLPALDPGTGGDFTPDDPDVTDPDDPVDPDPVDPDTGKPGKVKKPKNPRTPYSPYPAEDQPFPDPDPDPGDTGGGTGGGGGGEDTPGPWTPGPNPDVPSDAGTFVSMRSFAWTADPLATTDFDVGTLHLSGGPFLVKTEVIINGFTYAVNGDRVAALIHFSDAIPDWTLYATDDPGPPNQVEWPMGPWGAAGTLYSNPSNPAQLINIGNATDIDITSAAGGFLWGTRDPQVNEKSDLPVLHGYLAIWIYRP